MYQIEEPAVSAFKIPTEPQLINTAAATPDQFASPRVVPPTVGPEGIAIPPSKISQDAPAVESPAEDSSEDVTQPENLVSQESFLSTHHDSPLKVTAENKANRSIDQSSSAIAVQHDLSNLKPLEEERPIHTDPATHMKKTNHLTSPNLRPDEIGASDRKMGSADIVSDARPLSTIPVSVETESLPLPFEEKGGTESVAAEVTSTLSATVSTPVEGSSEIKSDQATKSAFVDVPSQSASENNPSAIIDFVIRKRSRQLGNQ